MAAEPLLEGAMLGRMAFSETWQGNFSNVYGCNDEPYLGMGCLEFSTPGDFNVGQEFFGLSKQALALPPHTLFMAGAFIGFINHTAHTNHNHPSA